MARTKKELLAELRGLLNAIEATEEPERIDQHLKEIAKEATKARRIADNSYWLIN